MRSALPTPATRRPWKARRAVGTSSVSVCANVERSALARPSKARRTNLVQQLERTSILEDLISGKEARLARPGRESRILSRSDNEVRLLLATVKVDQRDREGRLIVVKVELEDGSSLRRTSSSALAPNERKPASKLTSTGSMILTHDAQLPAAALGNPNTSIGNSATSSSTSMPAAF